MKKRVCHNVALPFYIKKEVYLKKAKGEELWKLNYISPMQKYNLPPKKNKSSKKETKISPSRYYYNSINN